MQNERKKGFVCVFRTPYKSEIAVIESLLIGNKIPYFIENQSFASTVGSMDGSINFGIMVELTHQKEAQELLKEFISPNPIKESESIKSEIEREYRKKHPIVILLSNIFYLIFGVMLWLLAIVIIKIPLSVKGPGEVVVRIVFILMFAILGFFVISVAINKMKSNRSHFTPK